MFHQLLLISAASATLCSALFVNLHPREDTASSTSTANDPLPTNQPQPPSREGVRIHPNFNEAKCATVGGGVEADGTPIILFDCDGTRSQNWIINQGNTKVQWAGTNWCLTHGGANNIVTTITQCSDANSNQNWFYSGDLRISAPGTDQCLDLTDGNLANDAPIQTYQCFDFNTNQIWSTS